MIYSYFFHFLGLANAISEVQSVSGHVEVQETGDYDELNIV